MNRDERYYQNVRAANKVVWDGINTLVSLQREYIAGDYGNSLPDGIELPAGDTDVNEHKGVTAAHLGSVVFDTANAMVGLLNSGHATNMQKLL